MAKTKYLVPFLLSTGGVPHYVYDRHRPAAADLRPGCRSPCEDPWGQPTFLEWRTPEPFEPPAGTAALEWHRGRSAANMILCGPVIKTVRRSDHWTDVIRATYHLTQAGVLGLLQAGAFDGPTIRPGFKLRPVKRGDNYLVEAA